ncbi:MAG: hypothetical protein ACYS6I_05910, partial [Planctomycetota bacterium]
TKRKIVFSFMFLLAAALAFETACAQSEAREKVIEFLRSAGLGDKLDAPVKISITDSGVICIADKGDFFNQYVITEPAVSADAAVVMDSQLSIPSSCTKAVIVTHGWIDKASGDWPADIAGAIKQRVDPNEWVCAFFDWTGGAAVMNPLDAAKYGRDVAGARLAKAVLKLGAEFKHIHLIAHSAGCWAIDDAAKRIVSQTGAEIHLTFLDAYVPPFWNQSDLGNFEAPGWAEHYYTKDITLAATHTDLSAAHNVDITAIDGAVPEHKFPYRWYYATVAGSYRPSDREKGREVVTGRVEIDYGFERSLEAGEQNWSKSLTLKKGRKGVQFGKDKKK